MDVYVVKIEYDMDQWDWQYADWKDELCQDFDENVVLCGNDGYNEHTDASWWQDAQRLVDAFDNYYFGNAEEFINYFSGEYATDKLEEIYKKLDSWDGRDRTEFIMDIASELNPGLDIRCATIYGSSQGDAQDVVYINDPDLYYYSIDNPDMPYRRSEFLQQLEDWYFGNTYMITVYCLDEDEAYDEDDDDPTDPLDDYDEYEYSDDDEIERFTVTSTSLWEMRNEGLASALGLPARTEIKVIDETR